MAFNIARGISGVGGAMVVPNAVAIIGMNVPAGKDAESVSGIVWSRGTCWGLGWGFDGWITG